MNAKTFRKKPVEIHLITHEMPDALRYLIAARSGRESLLLELLSRTHIRVSLPGGVVLAEIPEVPSTPQERALPRPSSTPPMWAVDPTRSRRRRNQ